MLVYASLFLQQEKCAKYVTFLKEDIGYLQDF